MAKKGMAVVTLSVTTRMRFGTKTRAEAPTPPKRLRHRHSRRLEFQQVLAAPMIPALNDMELERILKPPQRQALAVRLRSASPAA